MKKNPQFAEKNTERRCNRSNGMAVSAAVKRHAVKSSLQKSRYQTWRYEIETFLRVDFYNTADADIDGLSHCDCHADDVESGLRFQGPIFLR